MSSPPNRIVPAVGGSCSRISFDVVVLPHPDSPISPNVSPGQTAKSTPSTALTQPSLRRNSVPVLTGKYFWRFSSSSNGAGIFLQWLLIQEPAFCRPIRANLVIIRYRLLHRLELSWLAPRPRHPQADAAAQAEFSQL